MEEITSACMATAGLGSPVGTMEQHLPIAAYYISCPVPWDLTLVIIYLVLMRALVRVAL